MRVRETNLRNHFELDHHESTGSRDATGRRSDCTVDRPRHRDVYTEVPLTSPPASDFTATELTFRLTVENSPMSLGRVFGLLGTISLVPNSSVTSIGREETIGVQLTFAGDEPRKLDSLSRKLSQLTEMVSLAVEPGPD